MEWKEYYRLRCDAVESGKSSPDYMVSLPRRQHSSYHCCENLRSNMVILYMRDTLFNICGFEKLWIKTRWTPTRLHGVTSQMTVLFIVTTVTILNPTKGTDTETITLRNIWRFFFFSFVSLGGVRLSPLGTSATVGLLYQPWVIDDDYGAVGGMRIGRGNRSTRRKPATVPLCPPQIPHDLTWDRTQATTVGSQWLTAWAMARPF
jgi:hypothetical protein